jgi:hypothetical protein
MGTITAHKVTPHHTRVVWSSASSWGVKGTPVSVSGISTVAPTHPAKYTHAAITVKYCRIVTWHKHILQRKDKPLSNDRISTYFFLSF